MLQNNSLLAQLKDQIRQEIPRVTGVIKGTDKGFGFLECDDGESYFVPPPAMKQVLHGDTVEATVKVEGEKKSVQPEVLIETGVDRFVARVGKRDGRLNVMPDHPSINTRMKARVKRGINEEALNDGDWVVARLLRHPMRKDDRSFFAQIEEVIATVDNPRVPWRVTLARHALEQASPEGGTDWPLLEEGLTREDMTHVPFFTIDGEKTRDMDDALHIVERPEGGWTLSIAIADPTAYVPEGSRVDEEARTRSFTVYLPSQNVTMLPEILADDLCSLKEGEDRPTLMCIVDIDTDGVIGEPKFFAATMRSHHRLTYDNVSDWIEGQEGSWKPETEELAEGLRQLEAFTQARIAWRARNSQVFRERPDFEFELDEEGNVLNVRADHRRISNRMIEESMITANLSCARLLSKHIGHGIFNVHQGFAPEKYDDTIEFLAGQNITATPEQLGSLEGYRLIRQELDNREDTWLDVRMRRFQGYTVMSAQPGPHFGLGLEAYATWTSPIRKYGDMVNHRLIKRVILGQDVPAEATEQLTEHLSERRRLNRMAERDVKDWLYVRYLTKAAEEQQVFTGEIIDIRRGGMRVRLEENGASVFIPAPLIHSDRKKVAIDDKEGRVRIEDELRYSLGDIIKVSLTEAREERRSLVGRPAE